MALVVDEAPQLDRPAHLRPANPSSSWLAQRPAAVATAVLGLLAFLVAAISQGELWSTPDWRISVPALALTAIAAAISIARREHGGYPWWVTGLALAAAAVVLGWFLMVAIVIGATVVVMLILHTLM